MAFLPPPPPPRECFWGITGNDDAAAPMAPTSEPELAAASSIDRACFEYDRDLRLTVLTVLVLPPAGVVMMTSGLWK